MVMTNLEDFGVQRVVLNLYKHFDRAKVEPTLVLWSREGKVASFLPTDERVIETDLGLPWPRFVLRLPRYLQAIRALRSDVVLSFVPGTNVSMAMLKPFFAGSPALVTCEHAFLSRAFALGEYSGAFRLLYRALLKPMYNHLSDRVIMTSEASRDDAIENWHLRRERIELIYNPQDIAELRERAAEPVIDEPWLEDRSIPTFIAAGRLVHQKGFDSLVEAFGLFRKRRRGRLMILGRGPLEASLKRQVARAELDRDVRFLGFQLNHLKFIKRAVALVMSSRWEALPMILGETMAIGTPIISFDCPSGPRELLDGDRGGFIAADQDISDLALQMEYVIDHPAEATRRAQESMKRAETFDVRAVARQYEGLLWSVVRSRRAA